MAEADGVVGGDGRGDRTTRTDISGVSGAGLGSLGERTLRETQNLVTQADARLRLPPGQWKGESVGAYAKSLCRDLDTLLQNTRELEDVEKVEGLCNRIDALHSRLSARLTQSPRSHQVSPSYQQPHPHQPHPPQQPQPSQTSAQNGRQRKGRVRFADALRDAKDEYERAALQQLGREMRGAGLTQIGSAELGAGELAVYVDETAAVARRLANDPLAAPTVRPQEVKKSGQLPFRHDPVERYHLYKKEWDKYPVPGEQKRAELRWRVREYMLRQDLPVFVRQPVCPKK